MRRKNGEKVYIHIGGECSIPGKTIIGIFDIDEVTKSNTNTNDYLKKAEDEGRVETVSYDIPRSIIVAVDKIYISPISAGTIRKRANRWILSDDDNKKDGILKSHHDIRKE